MTRGVQFQAPESVGTGSEYTISATGPTNKHGCVASAGQTVFSAQQGAIMPAIIENHDPVSEPASMRAIRSARPTLRTAPPRMKPPSTSQKASDWKPENRTSAGAA